MRDAKQLNEIKNILSEIKEEKQKQTNALTWFENLSPALKFGGIIASIMIWSYSNFVTMDLYKHQQTQISDINVKMDKQYQELIANIEARHKEGLIHSDENRERMEAIMHEIKDAMKTYFLEGQLRRR